MEYIEYDPVFEMMCPFVEYLIDACGKGFVARLMSGVPSNNGYYTDLDRLWLQFRKWIKETSERECRLGSEDCLIGTVLWAFEREDYYEDRGDEETPGEREVRLFMEIQASLHGFAYGDLPCILKCIEYYRTH